MDPLLRWLMAHTHLIHFLLMDSARNPDSPDEAHDSWVTRQSLPVWVASPLFTLPLDRISYGLHAHFASRPRSSKDQLSIDLCLSGIDAMTETTQNPVRCQNHLSTSQLVSYLPADRAQIRSLKEKDRAIVSEFSIISKCHLGAGWSLGRERERERERVGQNVICYENERWSKEAVLGRR
jgi:hypothetical protein